VILDPLNGLVAHGSIRTDQGARRALWPLRRLAKETGVTILVVHHVTKAGSIAGSAGVEQACRVVYMVADDRDNADVKVLHLAKTNVLGQPEDLRYTLASTAHATRVVWQDRAGLDAQRRSWRGRLAARKTAPAWRKAAPAAGAYGASLHVYDGQERHTIPLGVYDSREAAQAACEAAPHTAGHTLTWRPYGQRTWTASSQHAGAVVSAAVTTAS
jgi:hypothetical protein